MAGEPASEDRSAVSEEGLELYGQFVENDYLVKAFSPRNTHSKLEWTIRVYRIGNDGEMPLSDTPIIEACVPIGHEPIFGFDAEDIHALEQGTDEILKALSDR